MIKIELDIDKDLCINPSDNSISINISTESGNTLQIKDDGLYAPAPKGPDGSGGTGYEGESFFDYVRVGYESPFTDTKLSKRVLCTNVVHRVFNATINDGVVTLNNFRNVDVVLVGDFFRVKQSNGKYKYYIVTKTSETANGLDNTVTSFKELGEW